MGIEKFIRTINNNKEISKNIFIEDNNIKNNFVYLDFNALIYNSIEEIEEELNYLLYEIIINKSFDTSSNLIISKYNNILNLKETNNITLEYFNDNISSKTNNILSQILIQKIKYFITSTTEYLYISFDGIPTMSKIIEQRKRRYINYIFDNIKKELCDKYKNSFNEYRNLYEHNKVYVSDINIKTQSDNLYTEIDNIKLTTNLKTIIYSSPKDLGEGEKKIFMDIVKQNKQGEYLIFSPDADVIILSLIILNKLNENNLLQTSIKICRSYQLDKLDIIDINTLRNNIVNYITNKVFFNLNTTKIINDICLLITFMGNDFLPAIISFKNKSSFSIIVDIYIKYLITNTNTNKYLTYNKNKIVKINYDNLNYILSLFSKIEHKLLIEKYASNNYKNFGYINFILELNTENNTFLDRLYYYVNNFNKIIELIKNNITLSDELIKNIIKNYSFKNYFIKQVLIIENNIKYEDITEDNILNLYGNYLDKIIDKIKNSRYYNNLKFFEYTDSIDDKFHSSNIILEQIHPLMEINNYDKEIYKFNNKLNEYKKILGINNNKLGYINISVNNNFYKIHTDAYLDYNMNNYYDTLINKINKGNTVKNLCNEYITGLLWNFDFYFNKYEKTNICIWSYKYNISPFIIDLYNYISKLNNRNNVLENSFNLINNDDSEYYVKEENFINELEHYIYISPSDKIKDNIPEKYKYIYDDTNIFPNLKEISNNILTENNYIYCDKGSFINKSIIKDLNNISYDNFMNKIRK
jgi:5'-3' exonuclease